MNVQCFGYFLEIMIINSLSKPTFGDCWVEMVLVLMTLDTDSERSVLDKLRKIPMVKEAHFLYGPYDAYVSAEAETTGELERLVFDKIRTIKGVRHTTTCFIAG